MKIDLSVKIKRDLEEEIGKNEKMALIGHLGTHFDVMNKEFSLDNTIRSGKVIDVSIITNRDIEVDDIKNVEIKEDDFIMFYTGFLKESGYGSKEYFKNHPQLSMELIDYLIEKGVSLIGIDAAGVRRGVEHTKTDQYCADKGIFIIENLDNLDIVLDKVKQDKFAVYTFPVNFEGLTGLPCRVVAEI